ncbi:hypothetical protein COAQ111491_08510 [Comamonas aquatilis]|uniref:hypothetical protein n=1 Tax=Comamonas aquatilis TaxID=1778406 RepID=UPI0039EF11B2
METIDQMSERHIRESEAGLQRVDELMKRAQQLSTKDEGQVETERLLGQAVKDREELEQHLAELKSRQESDMAKLAEDGRNFREGLEKIKTNIERLLASLL